MRVIPPRERGKHCVVRQCKLKTKRSNFHPSRTPPFHFSLSLSLFLRSTLSLFFWPFLVFKLCLKARKASAVSYLHRHWLLTVGATGGKSSGHCAPVGHTWNSHGGGRRTNNYMRTYSIKDDWNGPVSPSLLSVDGAHCVRFYVPHRRRKSTFELHRMKRENKLCRIYRINPDAFKTVREKSRLLLPFPVSPFNLRKKLS